MIIALLDSAGLETPVLKEDFNEKINKGQISEIETKKENDNLQGKKILKLLKIMKKNYLKKNQEKN